MSYNFSNIIMPKDYSSSHLPIYALRDSLILIGSLPDTRKSITSICFFIGKLPIRWKNKKQLVVSQSSSEDEYRALPHATSEGICLLSMLDNFNLPHQSPIIIYCDSKSTMHIATKPVFHEKTKHIEIDCHVVCYKVLERVVHIMPVTSKNQVVDILTKLLHLGLFYNLQAKLDNWHTF